MYHLIQLKVSKPTWENSSRYSEKLFKIRDYHELTEIDYGEWNELKSLKVEELYFSRIESLVEVAKKMKKIEKEMEKSLNKQ
jgi:hypothetical protein